MPIKLKRIDAIPPKTRAAIEPSYKIFTIVKHHANPEYKRNHYPATAYAITRKMEHQQPRIIPTHPA